MKYLKIFQQNRGLVPDGIVGINTLLTVKDFLDTHQNSCVAHFLGQVAHETAMFRRGVENLNYSANGLLNVFGKYFKSKGEAEEYARNPERIANLVYANRMGNGSVESGDGWKYRGRGALQLTGRDNYNLFSEYIVDDVVSCPDKVVSEYYFDSAKWFFDQNNLWRLSKTVDEGSIKKLSRRINGGYNGLLHRAKLTNKYYAILNES